MRINRFIAQATGCSRRAADAALAAGRIQVDGRPAQAGQDVTEHNHITLDGQPVQAAPPPQTIALNKPVGYVVSRNGQGSPTVYELLPPSLHHLKPIGRLDKDSSGLLLLTSDGQLANQLTHPRFQKEKHYMVVLNKPLAAADQQRIADGITLDDGLSRLQLTAMPPADQRHWQIIMHEGRNRQIRRTFEQLGYAVTALHRTQFGDVSLGPLSPGDHTTLTPQTDA